MEHLTILLEMTDEEEAKDIQERLDDFRNAKESFYATAAMQSGAPASQGAAEEHGLVSTSTSAMAQSTAPTRPVTMQQILPSPAQALRSSQPSQALPVATAHQLGGGWCRDASTKAAILAVKVEQCGNRVPKCALPFLYDFVADCMERAAAGTKFTRFPVLTIPMPMLHSDMELDNYPDPSTTLLADAPEPFQATIVHPGLLGLDCFCDLCGEKCEIQQHKGMDHYAFMHKAQLGLVPVLKLSKRPSVTLSPTGLCRCCPALGFKDHTFPFHSPGSLRKLGQMGLGKLYDVDPAWAAGLYQVDKPSCIILDSLVHTPLGWEPCLDASKELLAERHADCHEVYSRWCADYWELLVATVGDTAWAGMARPQQATLQHHRSKYLELRARELHGLHKFPAFPQDISEYGCILESAASLRQSVPFT